MIPRYEADLYTDEVLAEPYGHYCALRDLGPVVHLTAHDVHVVARYDEVRAVLADGDTFCSGQGVGLNDAINLLGRGTTLMTDGEDHRARRAVVGRPLTPRALAGLQSTAHALAEHLVDDLVARGSFDAVGDLAEVLPTTWVPDLLGWPDDGRPHLLEWGGATFDALGPPNDRTVGASAGLLDMAMFAARVATDDLPEGSMAAGVVAAARRGEIPEDVCPLTIVDYLGPSLDTTVSGLGNAVWLLATHPEQWDRLHADPARARHAFDEALRVESPISGFTRVVTRATDVAGVRLEAGDRLLVHYASANRDERRWEDPERFAIDRASSAHVAFGHGEHACVGMGLARLEAVAVLTALARRVRRIELTAPPERKLNNLIRSFGSIPVRVETV